MDSTLLLIVSLTCQALLFTAIDNVAGEGWYVPTDATPLSEPLDSSEDYADDEATTESSPEDLNSNVCSTSACKLTAERMLNFMDPRADPCQDFYQYTCGKWAAAHPAQSSGGYVSVFSLLEKTVNRNIHKMLKSKKASTFQSEEKAKAMYKQCHHRREERERLAVHPLLDLLDQYTGGWPVLNPNWNPDSFNLSQALTKLAVYGYDPLFTFDIHTDDENDAPPYVTLTRSDLVKPAIVNTDRTLYMDGQTRRIESATGLLLRDTGDHRTVDDSQIAIQLTQIVALKMDFVDMEDGESLILESKQNLPFSRSSLFRSFWGLVTDVFRFVDPSAEITLRRTINMTDSGFFDQLDKKLSELELLGTEGKRQLANYIGWVLISENLAMLSEDYRNVESDPDTPVSDSGSCAKKVAALMPMVVDAMYVREYVPLDTKPQITAMVENLKLGFEDLLILAQKSWMDNTTAAAAIVKLHAMTFFPAYQDLLVRGLDIIDDEYKEMHTGSDYFTTSQEARKLGKIKALKAINPDPAFQYLDVTEVDAFNDIVKNRVYVMAAILNSPFYDSEIPQYLNYGAIGSVIGHEITHGFDHTGRHFDSAGNDHEWWTDETSDAFEGQFDGLENQYNSFITAAGPVNGTTTLDENIADNGGLKSSYRAYFKHYATKLNQPELLLPRFHNFTTEQLFFLSAGQIWCTSSGVEQLRELILTDPHCPQEFRVVGPMSNMPEFAAAYHCPLGSRMNPVNKPAVW